MSVTSHVTSFSSLPSVSVLSSSFFSWKKCLSPSLHLRSFKCALSSFQLMLLGVRQKLSPREGSNFSSLVRSAVARFITVSFSRCLGLCLLSCVSLRV